MTVSRRDITISLITASMLLSVDGVAVEEHRAPGAVPTFAMLIHPQMILLDLAGPLSVFNLIMGEIHLVWKDLDAIRTVEGVSIAPTATFSSCPPIVDVLFVPGGLEGTTALLGDDDTIRFLRETGEQARYVTAVCTGTLLLGAAGLLTGRRATTHWYIRDLLEIFGATRSDERVVEDGRLVTGGGVTAGVDFALTIAARLRGDEWAKRIQLTLEYDPQPPFVGGSPEKAGPKMTDDALGKRAGGILAAREASTRAAANFKR